MSLTTELREIALKKIAKMEAARPAQEAAEARLEQERALAIYYDGYGEGRKTLKNCEEAASQGKLLWVDNRPSIYGSDTDPWSKGFIRAVYELMEESGGDLQFDFIRGQNATTGEPQGSILVVWWSEVRPEV